MSMNPSQTVPASLTRRQLFGDGAIGLGVPALLARNLTAADATISQRPKQFGGLPDLPHHPPKVKNVIYLLQNGAPPHVDTFDYKPQMEKFRGQELPESFHKNQRLSTMTQPPRAVPTKPATQ